MFRGTERPNEPITAGASPLTPQTGRTGVDPALEFLRVVYEAAPHPDILRLISDLQVRGTPADR